MGSHKASKYTIPFEYQDDLDYIPDTAVDTRADVEILNSLHEPQPLLSSEKNVWAFWHSGLESMPPWCQRNVTTWIRLLGPSWTIRVLNNVKGDPYNALNYIPSEMLPTAFLAGTMDGIHSGQHSADFIKGAVLYCHGGVYLDVGTMLFRHLDRICWDAIVDENKPTRVMIAQMHGNMIINHFVAARKGDPFIKRW
jgi:mannosyltransferase OCH1-like enzyme